jgi:hypothetical protein
MDGLLFLTSLLILALMSRWFGADSRPGIEHREGFFAFRGQGG